MSNTYDMSIHTTPDAAVRIGTPVPLLLGVGVEGQQSSPFLEVARSEVAGGDPAMGLIGSGDTKKTRRLRYHMVSVPLREVDTSQGVVYRDNDGEFALQDNVATVRFLQGATWDTFSVKFDLDGVIEVLVSTIPGDPNSAIGMWLSRGTGLDVDCAHVVIPDVPLSYVIVQALQSHVNANVRAARAVTGCASPQSPGSSTL